MTLNKNCKICQKQINEQKQRKDPRWKLKRHFLTDEIE